MESFLKQLQCRPEYETPPKEFEFQLIDLKIDSRQNIFNKSISRKKYLPKTEFFAGKSYAKKDTDNVVCLFGTATSGHSVCLFVNDFTPYFDISLQDSWSSEEIEKIKVYLQKNLSRRFAGPYDDKDEFIQIRTSIYTGPRIFGYIPTNNGQPKESKWLRLKFPSMDVLRAAKNLFEKKIKKNDQYSSVPPREKTFRKIFPNQSFDKLIFEMAGHNSPIEQMFLTLSDLVPSGWVRVKNTKEASVKYSTCLWELNGSMRSISSNPDNSSIAPCVTLSFDIECVPEKTANMPQPYREHDEVVQIGVSLEVTGVKKVHGVICLGETSDVKDVAILSCSTEIEVLNAFKHLVSDQRIDPDVITGYNIYKFDFFYMAQRVQRYEMLSEEKAEDILELWQKCKKYENYNNSFKSKEKQIKALQEAWSSYTPPWDLKKNIVVPPAMELLLESASTEDELISAINHFHCDANSIQFWWCSRLLYERCELRKVILESSAMGQNELFRFDMSGRCVFDLYLHCKNNMKMGSYSLNNVAKKFVGDQKIDLPYEEMFRMYKTGNPQDKAVVAEYCSKDCDLVLRIIQNAGIFTDNIEHSRVTYTLLTWLVTRGQQCRVYSQIGRFCERMNVALNHEFIKPPLTYTGATVIDPVKGYYEHPIATLDFASLYPSIMQAHNLCFSSLIFPRYRKQMEGLEKQGKVVLERIMASGEEHWFVQEKTYKGILPRLLHDLLSARRAVKKIMKGEKDPFKKQLLNSKQLALKISCNSVYGFTGSRTGKMGCWPIAACTTTIGRQMIDDTKAAVETKYDAKVVYGDTDSVMVKFNDASPTEEGMRLSWKLAEEAADYVTNVTFGDHDAVELEAEKVYWPYLIFDRKKRYIGRTYMHPDKPPKIDCKGVELVRRDNSAFLRDVYRNTVDNMMPPTGPALTKTEVLKRIREQVQKSLDDLIANKIELEKFSITKSLKKTYKNPNLPHVVLAEKIRARILSGKMMIDPPKAGDRISYVVIETKNTKDKLCDKTENIDWVKEKKLKIDREYYVSNQLVKPFNQIVKPFGSLDDLWENALSELKRQRLKIKSLKSYFTPVAKDSSIPNMVVVPTTQPPKKKLKSNKKKKVKKQQSLFSFA